MKNKNRNLEYLNDLPAGHLNADDEMVLVEKMRGGDAAARERLIESNLKLVIYAMKGLRIRSVDFDDLVSEGNKALIEAVDRYDPTHGARVGTYAYSCVRNRIIGLLYKNMKRGTNTVSLEAPVYHNNNTDVKIVRIKDTLADGRTKSAPDAADEKLRSFDIQKAVSTLPPRSREVLNKNYGLDGESVQTLQTIGDTYGVSRERVRQIKDTALLKLKKYSKKLETYASEVTK